MPGCEVRHFLRCYIRMVAEVIQIMYSWERKGVDSPTPHKHQKAKDMVKVTENWASTLRGMNVGEIVIFPISSISSVNTTISRLRLEMCMEGADWKRVGEIDRKKGEFKVKRVS